MGGGGGAPHSDLPLPKMQSWTWTLTNVQSNPFFHYLFSFIVFCLYTRPSHIIQCPIPSIFSLSIILHYLFYGIILHIFLDILHILKVHCGGMVGDFSDLLIKRLPSLSKKYVGLQHFAFWLSYD